LSPRLPEQGLGLEYGGRMMSLVEQDRWRCHSELAV
jgi:hypothetical protein